VLRTIIIGTSVFVQGVFVRNMPNGHIAVRVDDRLYAGRPV